MKKHFFFCILIFAIAKPICSQDSLIKIERIDSLVARNELNVSSIYQKTEKSRIENMHGRNPEKVTDIYRFSATKTLLSISAMSYSVGDTDLIFNLYFDSNVLIMAKAAYFDLDKKKVEFLYYYDNNELINKDAEMAGIHKGSYFLEFATRIRRNLRKRPIKFP